MTTHPSSDTPPCLAGGEVTLVGAGPGDPEQLTLKAVKAIAAASLLLVDDLVDEAVLQYASAHARIIRVGKRGGRASTAQDFIDKLMLTAAREGEHVVRLKGGDPLIFGRGGEEAQYLQAHGIKVNVINGVSAGLAAANALGIALTHREHAHGVVFVTGHARPGGKDVDWAALGRTAHSIGLTLVIYMGVGQIRRIQNGLLQGLPGETSAAVVQSASRAQQQHVLCELRTLEEVLTREGLGSPAVIIVGDVLKGAALAASGRPENTRFVA